MPRAGASRKPRSPVPPQVSLAGTSGHGEGPGSLLAHTSWARGAPPGGARGAHLQPPVGLFTWRFYSPTELLDCV